MTTRLLPIVAAIAVAAVTVSAQQTPPPPAPSGQPRQQTPPDDQSPSFRFKSAVDLINVTTTVTDASGRFVSNLRQEDFRVLEDGKEQPITHFSSERVPVSLGIVLDTSFSMEGEKMTAAREALQRFLFDLLGPEDEVFLYRFSNYPQLLERWTTDRQRLGWRLDRITPNGGTALYDAVAEAIPLAQTGRHRKKALLIISDGNDTNSQTSLGEVKRQIRQSEVLVYAIGIDSESSSSTYGAPRVPSRQPPQRFPFPFPMPGGGGRTPSYPPPGGGQPRGPRAVDERVNADALRALTDDSGGRTEIVRWPRDLDPATTNIADELSKQYSLGYPAPGKNDGRWHAITVQVRGEGYNVRARRGYMASSN